jgi:hypothetical protein
VGNQFNDPKLVAAERGLVGDTVDELAKPIRNTVTRDYQVQLGGPHPFQKNCGQFFRSSGVGEPRPHDLLKALPAVPTEQVSDLTIAVRGKRRSIVEDLRDNSAVGQLIVVGELYLDDDDVPAFGEEDDVGENGPPLRRVEPKLMERYIGAANVRAPVLKPKKMRVCADHVLQKPFIFPKLPERARLPAHAAVIGQKKGRVRLGHEFRETLSHEFVIPCKERK